MAFALGTRLGPYEVVALLGEGGMGQVYRAKDSRLKRDVALKVLPEAFAADPDRIARFQREAELLATLNHPNIAHIYGFEDSNSTHALVLELVEGPTLADRIARGPIPLEDALPIAKQIAEALEAAHEQGIIHRDLKTANVKVREDGTVKVLDFGLAKLADPVAASVQNVSVTASPTITTPAMMTGVGMILGTAAYMSPEQARGKTVDKRSDIWAFGCVLYEMLTGRRAFVGTSVTETLAGVLERDVDWTKLPGTTPPSVRTVLRRVLEKDPRRRLHDIADARLELDDNQVAVATTTSVRGDPTTRRWIAALLATAIVVGLGTWSLGRLWSAMTSTAATVTRLTVAPNVPLTGDVEGGIALSPDGRVLAYVAGRDGQQQVYLHELDQFDDKPIPGTDGASNLAFSPDGTWLAFTAQRKIKRVAVAGGQPVEVADVESDGLHGLSWETNETILFNLGQTSGISRVSASGGTPTAVTRLVPGELEHRYPAILPGGNALLYSVYRGGAVGDNVRVVVQSLSTGERREIASGAGARYLPTGRVAYVQAGAVFSVPFDLTRLEVTGAPTLALQGVRETSLQAPQISFAQMGSVAYLPGDRQGRDALVWVDRSGKEQPTGVTEVALASPRLAPDLRRVAVAVSNGRGVDLWAHDIERGTRERLTFDESNTPVWAPDGVRFAYGSRRHGVSEIYVKTLGSATPDQRLATGPDEIFPFSWSPDGRFLAGVAVNLKTRNDIWVYGVDDGAAARPFIQTPFAEGGPTFSHDGHWIAYASQKSGRSEIYMSPFPGPGQEWTISTEGGNEPVWARKTGQLFYRQGDAMMAVDVTTTPTLVVGKPRRIFDGVYNHSVAFWANYDVTPDGQRFLMVKGRASEAPTRINVVLNWQEELKQRVPTK